MTIQGRDDWNGRETSVQVVKFIQSQLCTANNMAAAMRTVVKTSLNKLGGRLQPLKFRRKIKTCLQIGGLHEYQLGRLEKLGGPNFRRKIKTCLRIRGLHEYLLSHKF